MGKHKGSCMQSSHHSDTAVMVDGAALKLPAQWVQNVDLSSGPRCFSTAGRVSGKSFIFMLL